MTGEVAPEASIAPQTARRMDRMITVALGYFAVDKFVLASLSRGRHRLSHIFRRRRDHLSRVTLRIDPVWDPLRKDPRFQKLCEDKQT
ncbi:MAG: hypothetical protein ABI839_08845 [Verrucomicrobiota bacterium]